MKSDEQILTQNGWVIECESPFEIRHEESNSFATNQAAYAVIFSLRDDENDD
jgi:hypothetical protein